MVFGREEGGKGYSRGQEQDWMGCLEHDLSLFHLPTEAEDWTLAAKKPGSKCFTRVEEAAEQYTKRWTRFDAEKEQVAKLRALEVQTNYTAT